MLEDVGWTREALEGLGTEGSARGLQRLWDVGSWPGGCERAVYVVFAFFLNDVFTGLFLTLLM